MHQQTRHRPASLAYCPFTTGHHQILIILKPNWLLQLGSTLTLHVLSRLSPPPPKLTLLRPMSAHSLTKWGQHLPGDPGHK